METILNILIIIIGVIILLCIFLLFVSNYTFHHKNITIKFKSINNLIVFIDPITNKIYEFENTKKLKIKNNDLLTLDFTTKSGLIVKISQISINYKIKLSTEDTESLKINLSEKSRDIFKDE